MGLDFYAWNADFVLTDVFREFRVPEEHIDAFLAVRKMAIDVWADYRYWWQEKQFKIRSLARARELLVDELKAFDAGMPARLAASVVFDLDVAGAAHATALCRLGVVARLAACEFEGQHLKRLAEYDMTVHKEANVALERQARGFDSLLHHRLEHRERVAYIRKYDPIAEVDTRIALAEQEQAQSSLYGSRPWCAYTGPSAACRLLHQSMHVAATRP